MSFWEEVLKHSLEPANFIEAMFSFGSIILSVVALVVSTVTFCSQKKHKKNSVRPILNIVFGDYENNIYVRVDNNGVGPAIIKNIECTYCSEKEMVTKKSLIDLFEEWISTQVDADYISEKIACFTDFVENIAGRTIAPDHEIVLLKLTNPDYGQAVILRRFLKEVHIEVSYTDIYNTKPWKCRRACDFFGRSLPAKVVAKIRN